MSKVSFKFELGDRLRDRVSGYEGICDMRGECLNGCLRYSLQAGLKEDGSMKEGYWIDEGQLEKIDKGVNAKPVKKSKTGGPVTRSPSYGKL